VQAKRTSGDLGVGRRGGGGGGDAEIKSLDSVGNGNKSLMSCSLWSSHYPDSSLPIQVVSLLKS